MSRTSDLDGLRLLQAKLTNLPDTLYRDRHGNPCRHPSGLYSTSRAKVFKRMQAFTEEVRVERRPDEVRGNWPTAIAALEALFAAIDTHADDLKTVIFASAPTLSKRTAMRAARLIDEIFEDLVGRPYNRIKHNGEILEVRCCFDTQIAIYGYYVAALREDGAVAPSRRAHGTTGSEWSFAVTIRRLLAQMIRAARTIESYLSAAPKPELAPWTEEEGAALRDITEWAQRCPPYCFPNEASLPIPDVGMRDGMPYVHLDTIKRLRSVAHRQALTWSRSFTCDGKSRTFSVE